MANSDTPPTETLSDRIANALTEQIVRGDLAPGEKLRQDHIAQAHNASHVPVREAFLRLVAKGLATNEPRRGVRVAPLSRDDMREVLDMRLALEVLALRHAAPVMAPADFARVDAARISCDLANNRLDWEIHNRGFHYALVSPCAMPRLLAEIGTLQLLSARHFHAAWRADWESRTDIDHRNILSALLRKDTEAAVAILIRHLQRMR